MCAAPGSNHFNLLFPDAPLASNIFCQPLTKSYPYTAAGLSDLQGGSIGPCHGTTEDLKQGERACQAYKADDKGMKHWRQQMTTITHFGAILRSIARAMDQPPVDLDHAP